MQSSLQGGSATTIASTLQLTRREQRLLPAAPGRDAGPPHPQHHTRNGAAQQHVFRATQAVSAASAAAPANIRTPLQQTIIPHLRGLPPPRTPARALAPHGGRTSSRRQVPATAATTTAASINPRLSYHHELVNSDGEQEGEEGAQGGPAGLAPAQRSLVRGNNRSDSESDDDGCDALDGDEDEAAAVLSLLRDQLTGPEPRASAIVTADECGSALLDLVSVLLLLDEDVRQALPGAVVLFQPVLDLKNKLAALARPGAAAAAAAQPAYAHVHSPGVATAAAGLPRLQHSAWLPGPGTGTGTGASGVPQVAVLVTRARCTKLLTQQPACCIAATLHMDCGEITGVIASTIEAQGSTRLRVASSPEGLVAAWRALKGVRAIVRARSHGQRDVLVTPHMAVEPTPLGATRGTGRPAMPTAAAVGDGAGLAQELPQQAVMFFNVWLR